jgi:hypothetical protein
MRDQFWYEADLNAEVPVKDLILTVSVPKKAGVVYRGFGIEHEPEIKDEGTKTVYRWRITDAYDSSEEEEFTPPPRTGDLRNRIEFSSTKHWDDISDWYYSLIRKNSVSDGSVDAAARELVKVAKNDREKVRVILEYIQEQFRYVMMAFEENNLEPHNVDDVLRNRYGDCKDLSLLMVNMLKASGIKANIALFSLESDTSDPEDRLPSVSMFDHIVVEVEDAAGNYYVDPVLKGYDIGQYPVDYQGAYTFVITGLGGRFGRLPVLGEKKSYQRDIRSITIRPDGSAMVEWRSLYDLDSSVSVRKLWQGATDKGRRRFKEEMEGLLAAGGRVFENGFENIDAKYGTVTNAVKFERPGMYTLTGDIMVVDIEGFDRKEIFTRKERVKPIFYPYNSRADRRTIINIPEGFQVLHLPENFTENMGFFGLNRSFKNGAGRVDIYETEWYKRKEVPASDYKAIQGFLNDLAVKSRQQIILKRAE